MKDYLDRFINWLLKMPPAIKPIEGMASWEQKAEYDVERRKIKPFKSKNYDNWTKNKKYRLQAVARKNRDIGNDIVDAFLYESYKPFKMISDITELTIFADGSAMYESNLIDEIKKEEAENPKK